MMRKQQCVLCIQGTQKGSGTSHSSSSSQVGSSPNVERRQRSGLHRTIAAVGQTEPIVTGCARFDSQPSYSAVDTGKSLPEGTASLSVKYDSPKDKDFTQDFVEVGSSQVDIRSPVHDGRDGSCGHPLGSSRENSQIPRCKPASYCKLHRRKPISGRRPQSASDVDQCQAAADLCSVNTSESMSTLEERFNRTLYVNMKLAEKLATTCRQMEVLTLKLREFEV